MKITVDESMFVARFDEMNRSENFSRAGRRALFQYIEDLESDAGEELELDVIGLCCEFSEDTIENVLVEYDLESIEDLRDSTTVIEVDKDTIVYQCF